MAVHTTPMFLIQLPFNLWYFWVLKQESSMPKTFSFQYYCHNYPLDEAGAAARTDILTADVTDGGPASEAAEPASLATYVSQKHFYL